MKSITIKPFENASHREQVVSLWQAVFGYETAHNSPNLVINKKTAIADGLFFVAIAGVEVVGTIMAGGNRSGVPLIDARFRKKFLPDQRFTKILRS